MSKDKLFEIIDTPYKELNELKIGVLVRATLPYILNLELISDFEIKKLQSQDHSKMIFDMNYSIIKKVDEKLSIQENRTVINYTRYYADPVIHKNSKYLITSEWYDRNQEYYIKWFKRKVIKQ